MQGKQLERGGWRLGFTLLEVLVVLSVISLFTALSLSAVTGLRSLLAERESWIRFTELTQALRLYRIEKGDWPSWLRAGEVAINEVPGSWLDGMDNYYDGPFAVGEFRDGYGYGQVYVLVDLDEDNWIVADDFRALSMDQRPQRLHARVAAYSMDPDGRLVASTWK